MFTKIAIGILFLVVNLYSQNIRRSCSIDNDIMLSILKTESHKDKTIGYPYLISFNNRIDQKIVRKTSIKKYLLDNRTIDCKDKDTCIKITKTLLEVGINNLDLGAFQINYEFHKMKVEKYFSFKESYFKACSFISKLIKNHGYNWRTIAMYHSATPKYNYNYLKKISLLTKKGE